MTGFDHDIIKIALDKGYITKRNAVKLLNILKYGELTCELCLELIPKNRKNKNRKLTFDHKLPKSLGGNGDFENLQIAHARCNRKKGNKK